MLWPVPASPQPSMSIVNGEYLGSPKANSSSKVEVGFVKTSVTWVRVRVRVRVRVKG